MCLYEFVLCGGICIYVSVRRRLLDELVQVCIIVFVSVCCSQLFLFLCVCFTVKFVCVYMCV